MFKNKSNSKLKHKKGTAAARVIPALLLCLFVLTGALYFMSGEEQPQNPVEVGNGTQEQENGSVLEEVPAPPTTEELMMEYIEDMTLEEKVGQMFLIRCPEEEVASKVQKYQPGGVIFFARDFSEKGPDQVQSEIASYQEVSRVPLLTAVDEEGGTVTRISRYSQYRAEPFAGPQELYASGGWDLVVSDTVEKCQLLSSLGLNVNMAPVCDMTSDTSAYIYPRTFGSDAEGTSEYVKRVVSTMSDGSAGCIIGSVLKHFPGYGGNSDTHAGFSVDSRPYSVFEESDFLPFQAGIEAGAGAVLVSHNIVTCMDAETPASLSMAVHEILRGELGFEGVIMTDDLVMNAITEAYGAEEAAVLAVKAGNDMLCCTDYKTQIPAVIAAVESGEIAEERIDESVLRVLLWKHQLGLVEVDAASASTPTAVSASTAG